MTEDTQLKPLDLIRMESGDPWGECMEHAFSVAAVVYSETGRTPARWDYRPSPLGVDSELEEYPAREYRDALRDGDISLEGLIYAGDVLARYSRALRHAGRAY